MLRSFAAVLMLMMCTSTAGADEKQPGAGPSRPWMVYLVQHTHTDIGFTRPQSEMLPEHLRFIDEALDYCDLTDDYADDAKFRWTCEAAWAVREYFARRPASQIERLKKRIKEGRIEVTGMFVNMSEIATEASLAASLQPIHEWKDAGIPVILAMQNDVNGAAWCLVDYLQPIGVKYITMGINRTRSLLPFDKPTAFWWESPAGKRVLALRSDHYHMGNLFKIHEGNLESFHENLLKYLQKLEEKKYPFERIVLPFSGYHTDNSPPAIGECALVRKWNARYDKPHLRMATASEFMDWVAKQHGSELPVYRQGWPDWWTDGFGSAARETAAARQTHAEMLATQGLFAMSNLMGADLPREIGRRAMSVHDAATLYDEHTFGASTSIQDPACESSVVQWGQKSSFAWDAFKQAGMLREEAIGALEPMIARTSEPSLVVFNTLSWPRSGLCVAFIDHELLAKGAAGQFIDAKTGETAMAQVVNDRAEGCYWAIWAKDVPPLGYNTYTIGKGRPRPTSVPHVDAAGSVFENTWYRLTVNAKSGGIASLIDKELGRDLVDASAPWPFGQLICERLKKGDRQSFPRDGLARTGTRNVAIKPGSGGPVWRSVVIRADLDGAEPASARVEIRLYETEKRIEIACTLRKLPVRDPEGVYVAFPFAWPDGKIRFEGQGGLISPGENQIPNSASDWQTVQSFAAIRSDAGQIIWASPDIPLVQWGDLNCGKWQSPARIDHPYIYSWPMNNYWFTNFNATQQGELKWSYHLTSTADASNGAATRFGWGSQVPLVARALPPVKAGTADSTRRTSASLLKCDAANLLLVEARPAWHGRGIILHWREIEGKPARLNLADQPSATAVKSVDEVDVIEETLNKGLTSASFAPYEVKFVRLNTK